MITFLLQNKAEVNAVNRQGETAFLHACRTGRKEIFEILLEKGADIDAVDKRGNTALLNAVMSSNWDTVNFLLSKGADANVTNRAGYTALGIAEETGAPKEIVKLFKKKNAKAVRPEHSNIGRQPFKL